MNIAVTARLACLTMLLAASQGTLLVAQQPAVSGNESRGNLEVVQAGKPVRKSLTLTTTQPARIAPFESAPMESRIAGYVSEVLVDVGDKVTKGQTLVRLSAPEIEAELNQKRALLEQAKAEVRRAGAGRSAAEVNVRTAGAKVVQAEAGIRRVDADATRWKAELARLEKLVAGGSINAQLLDETRQKLAAAEAARDEAAAAVEVARASVLESQAEVVKAESDLVAMEALVRVAEANVAHAQAMTSYLTIVAPLDGVVTKRQVDPGHFARPATGTAAPLLTVARVDKLRVFVAIPESEAASVDLGDPVTLEVKALRGAEFSGRVSRTGFAVDPTTRALETVIDLEQPGELRPGMYAMARLTLTDRPNVLTLPATAVVRQGKEAFCNRLLDGRAVKTPIQLGIQVADEWEIVGGLQETETVILNKASSLKDGQLVEVAKTEPKK